MKPYGTSYLLSGRSWGYSVIAGHAKLIRYRGLADDDTAVLFTRGPKRAGSRREEQNLRELLPAFVVRPVVGLSSFPVIESMYIFSLLPKRDFRLSRIGQMTASSDFRSDCGSSIVS